MDRKHIPSTKTLCHLDDPFSDIEILIQRLMLERSESRYIEWKLTAPIGSSVTKKTKFRVVKAAASFANTDGGFIIFGVVPTGNWTGISKADRSQVDPASLADLFNSHVSPDIQFSYCPVEHNGLLFAILHIPQSPFMPHIVVKEVFNEKKTDGKRPVLLAKYAVYCRYGGKSDLANPTQFEQIITFRTNYLKTELLRRIREVPVPIPVSVKSSARQTETLFHGIRTTQDPNAPAFRLTHDADKAEGILLHEKLSDELFDEINNILDANAQLARGHEQFVLGDNVYYHIYADRTSVKANESRTEMLARTGLIQLYGPVLYWFLRLTPQSSGALIRSLLSEPKSPQVYSLLRIAILLGSEVSNWILENWDRQWQNVSQPPNYYFRFQKMLSNKGVMDRRLIALGIGSSAQIVLPGQKQLKVGDLLKSPQKAVSLLSEACLLVFGGHNGTMRGVCRDLDILAYGQEIEARSPKISEALITNP